MNMFLYVFHVITTTKLEQNIGLSRNFENYSMNKVYLFQKIQKSIVRVGETKFVRFLMLLKEKVNGHLTNTFHLWPWRSTTEFQQDYWIGLAIRMLLLISLQKKRPCGL